MKRFLKDNLAIVAAIALPLILVIVFALSTSIVSKMVADPQYDFLIATNFYGGTNEAFYFDVVQNRLKISYAYPVGIKGGGYQNGNISRLWRVRVPAMTVEEISLVPPARGQDDADGKRVPIDIPGVSDLHVISTQPAPDGYVFQESYDYYGGNLMREIFSGSGGSNRHTCAIVKDGRAVPVKNLGGNSYNYYNTHFIGWIVKNQ
jgi:hypothetical protein